VNQELQQQAWRFGHRRKEKMVNPKAKWPGAVGVFDAVTFGDPGLDSCCLSIQMGCSVPAKSEGEIFDYAQWRRFLKREMERSRRVKGRQTGCRLKHSMSAI